MNLAWKEFRESYPVVLLGLGVIVIEAVLPAFSGDRNVYGQVWGVSFHYSGSAILLFIAMVLGVTAYAREEETGTLEPLLARPVPQMDVAATKIGIRLGLIFAAVLLFGLLEVLTRAVPEYRGLPLLEGYLRWLCSVLLLAAGFAAGLYFGKSRGTQTRALIYCVLLFAMAYVLLFYTPLSALFEGPEGPTPIGWVRSLLLPGSGAALFIWLSLRGEPQQGGLLPEGSTAVAGIVLYGLLLWGMTIVPDLDVWRDPSLYWDHVTMRYGSGQSATETYLETVRDLEWLGQAEDPDERLRLVTAATDITLYEVGSDLDIFIDSSLLHSWTSTGARDPRVEARYAYRFRSFSDTEEFLTGCRGPEFFGKALGRVRTEGYGPLDRSFILHAAGHAAHEENIPDLVPFLSDPEPPVRILAAFALRSLGDPRGVDHLLKELPDYAQAGRERRSLFSKAFSTYGLTGAMTEEQFQRVHDLAASIIEKFYQEELTREDEPRLYEPGRELLGWAMNWIGSYGRPADGELLRKARWSILTNAQQAEQGLDDIRLRQSYMEWDYGMTNEEILAETRQLLEELRPQRERAFELGERRTFASTPLGMERSRLYGRFRELGRHLELLLEHAHPEALRTIQDDHELLKVLQTATWGLDSVDFLRYLPDYGEEGLDELDRIADDADLPMTIRVHAGLLLVEAGHGERIDWVMRMVELHAPEGGQFWNHAVPGAYMGLLAQGHLAFAGPLLEVTHRRMRPQDREPPVRVRGVRPTPQSTWVRQVTTALERGTGEDYGWDIDAWTAWWEREGRSITTGENE